MDTVLTPIQARVVGALIEKEITTPDYYPLTLNALTNACNQKTNRDPVLNLDEKTIARALEQLRFKKHLVWEKDTLGSRVPKYAHRLDDQFSLSSRELGALCVLLLRGPQTAGEIRARASRLCKFNDPFEVENILKGLMERADGPFVVKLPRQPGRSSCRYAHLFCGEVKVDEEIPAPPPEAATRAIRAENERLGEVEKKIFELQKKLEKLKKQFVEFKGQFE